MAFESFKFTQRQQEVAEGGLNFFKERYGRNGLKIGEEIDSDIPWRPTFQLRPTKSLIIAVEINDILYPEILKIAAHDIDYHDHPISVYQVCPLEIFIADSKQTKVGLLKKHGFGLVTVNDRGNATMQCSCIPLAQHIDEDKLKESMINLTPTLKVRFRGAYETYKTNEVQGLQETGQIVEALIESIAEEAISKGHLNLNVSGRPAADIIDELYISTHFQNQRACLGEARGFVKENRNIASHPANSPKKAIARIRKCKSGFLDALRIATHLRELSQTHNYRLNIS